jgi:putative ABC transport system permease protein
VLVTGIGVPLIAAAFPIIKGSAIRVREAISDYGTGTESFENTYFDWVVSFLGGRFRPLLMVVRNTLRRRKRFLLTVATLVVSGIAFISALNFRASIIRTLDRSFENKRYDLWVSLEGMYPIDMLQAAAHESIGIVRVEAWTVADASFAAPDGSALHPLSGRPSSEGRSDGRFTIIGLPTQTALFRMEILSGRSLRPDDRNAVVVNSSLLSRNPGLSVGQTIALRIGPVLSRWNIVGISREAFSPATAYVSRDRLNEIDGQTGLANSLRLAVESGDINTLWRTRADLDRRLVAVGVVAAGSSTKPDLRYAFDQHMSMIYIFLLVTSGLVATIGGLGLMTSTTLIVIERQREIGVLRVIGATTWMVSLTVIAESILTALVSWIAATVISWPVSKELGNWISITMFQTKLDFQFDPIGPVVWLALSIVIAIIASALPAIRISQFTISRALVAE